MRRFFLICLLTLSWSSQPAGATTYDLWNDFSPTSNPTGAWSYGQKSTLSGGFSLFTTSCSSGGFDAWGDCSNGPTVNHNNTTGTITWVSIVSLSNEVHLHPSIGGILSVVRFTAPTTSVYDVNSSFYGIDQNPTTTDVHVLLNDVSVFDAFVNGYRGAGHNYAASALALAAGDTLDFVVGFGANSNWGFDSTGVTATIAEVPEPGTFLLASIGLLGLSMRRRFSRKG